MRYSYRLHKSRNRHSLFSLSALFIGLFLLVFLLILFGATSFGHIPVEIFFSGLLVSLARVSIAYVLGLVVSIVLALVVTSHKQLETIFLPVFDVLQSFPSFALFPILVGALAREPNEVIVMVLALEIIWPILFAILSGIKGRRRDLEEAATVFGAVGGRRLFAFTLPMLLPSIVTGSIVGWGEAWEFIIGAELLVQTRHGVGQFLGQLGADQQTTALAYGITLLMLFLFLINKLIWLPLLERSTNFQVDG